MEALAAEAIAKFGVRDVAKVHRLGRLEIGETSILIAVASAHRGVTFEACRWLIDTVKKQVPIWKKEQFVDGAVWVDGEPLPVGIAPGEQLLTGSGQKSWKNSGGDVLDFGCRRRLAVYAAHRSFGGAGRTSPANFMRSSFRSTSSVLPATHEIAFDKRHFVLPAGRL